MTTVFNFQQFLIPFLFLVFSRPSMHLSGYELLQLPFSNQCKDRYIFEKINRHCKSMQKEFLSVNSNVNKVQIKGPSKSDETFE